MNRSVFAGVVALAVFAVGAFVAVRVADGPETPPRSTPRTETPAVSTAPVAVPAVATAAPPAAVAEPATASESPRPEPPAGPAAKDWDSVPVAVRVSDLGRVAGPVNAALQLARDRMDSCFVEESRRLERGPPAKIDPNDPPRGPAVVVLQLEGAPGELRIVDASLDYLGTSTRDLVSCCEQHLVGVRIPAPAAADGQRFRMKYLLQ